jgi:hypothetical protein
MTNGYVQGITEMPKSAMPDRKPYVGQSMDALESGIVTLEELVEQIGIRLAPCLAAENGCRVGELKTCLGEHRPALSERIDSVTDKLTDVSGKLRELTGRIEL